MGEVKQQLKEKQKYQIPTINRDGSLITRLFPIVLGGLDGVLDKESQLYFRLLCRLVDKSFNEYSIAKKYIEKEIKIGNKFTYRFIIIDHLENCINAINRAAKIFKILIDGKIIKKKNKKIKVIKKNYNLLKFINKHTLEKIKKYGVSEIRNRVEHIEEDIYLNKFKAGLFLDIDKNYKNICINKRCLKLSELVSIIKDYHKFVLEIIQNV